jgi:TP901 family phage tail tape measure protein
MASPRGLQVFVNIGARVASSVGASASTVEKRLSAMGKRIRLANAEAKAASRGLMSSGDVRGAIFDSAAVGYGAAKFLEPAIMFESKMLDLKQLSGGAIKDTKAFGFEVMNLGKAFGFAGGQVADTVGAYLSVGMDVGQSMMAAKSAMLIARATGSDLAETNDAVMASMRNLKIPAGDIVKTFGMIRVASQEGRFELKDMAAEFSRVASSASRAGLTGSKGAALLASQLQVVEEGTGDANQAATNLQNFYDKIYAPVTRKKFQSLFKIDLRALEKTAAGDGEKFVNSILDAMAKTSKNGKDQFAIGEIWEDVQARAAVVKLIQEREKVNSIYKKSLAGQNVITEQFAQREGTALAKLQKARANLVDFQVRLGTEVIPRLNTFIDGFTSFMNKMDDFTAKNPGFVNAITSTVITLGGLFVAGKAVEVIGTGFARMAIATKWLWKVLSPFAAGAMAPAVAFFADFGAILAWAGVPAIAAIGGIALALVALGLGVAWVVAKWEGIKAFFKGFAEGVAAGMSPGTLASIQAMGDGLVIFGSVVSNAFNDVIEAVGKFFGPMFSPPKVDNWRAFGEEWGKVAGDIIEGIAITIRLIGELRNALKNPFTFDWSGMTARAIKGPAAPNYQGLFSGRPAASAAGAAAGTIIGQSAQRAPPAYGRPAPAGAPLPAPPSTFSPRTVPMSAPARQPTPRAYGGTARSNEPHLVGERGREIFVPGKTGTVIPARTTEALMRGANDNGGGVTIGDIHIHGANDPQSTRQILRDELKRLARGQSALLSD